MAAAALQLEAAVPRRRQPVVLYHYPCPDGVFAALAAHLHFRQSGLDVRWVPNRVFAPATVAGLILEVSCPLAARQPFTQGQSAAGVTALSESKVASVCCSLPQCNRVTSARVL